MKFLFYRVWKDRWIYDDATNNMVQMHVVAILRESIPEVFDNYLRMRYAEQYKTYTILHIPYRDLSDVVEAAKTFDITMKPWS